MKLKLLSTVLFILIISHTVNSQDNGVGIGLILGEPTDLIQR